MAETKILVTTEPFDIGEETARIREGSPDMGAIVTFTGVVRNVNDGSNVTAMTLEHYPGMTQKSLAKIVETARGRWPLGDVTVIHRVGRMVVGEEIVLVAVASRHRHAAFEAASFIMDWSTRARATKKRRHVGACKKNEKDGPEAVLPVFPGLLHDFVLVEKLLEVKTGFVAHHAIWNFASHHDKVTAGLWLVLFAMF